MSVDLLGGVPREVRFREELERRWCRSASDLLRAAKAFPEGFQDLCFAYGYDSTWLLSSLQWAIPVSRAMISSRSMILMDQEVRVWLIG